MSAQQRLMDFPPLTLGVDPGGSGGFALLGENVTLAYPMPDTETDVAELLREYAPYVARAYVEAVHAMPPHMPGNTSVASFKFGKAYGFVRGVLVALKVPFEDVSPQKWKKAVGLHFSADDSKTEKKNGSKQLAQQWFPSLKITHATSEALLIAEYGRRLRNPDSRCLLTEAVR